MPNTHARLDRDRGPTLCFAGRVDELDILHHGLERTLRDRRSAINGVVLITGVPGIGKTQLTEEFVRHVEKNSSAKCLYVGVDTLRSPLHMFRAIAEKLGVRGVRRSVLREFEKSAGLKRQIVGVQAGAATERGGVTVSDAVDKAPPPFEAMLASVSGHATWTDAGALVLVVDEVQSASPDALANLAVLHTGRHGCPIFAVAAGLQHSPEVVAPHGMSRHTALALGLLSDEETRDAIAGALEAVGIEITADAIGSLARASMNFPQHVNGYIRGVAQVFDKGVDVNSRDGLVEAIRLGTSLRTSYYAGRMRAMPRVSRIHPLAIAMNESGREKMPLDEGVDIVGESAINDALKHGVLAIDEDDVLSFGIPSFLSHMVESARRYELARAPQRTAVWADAVSSSTPTTLLVAR